MTFVGVLVEGTHARIRPKLPPQILVFWGGWVGGLGLLIWNRMILPIV